MERLGAIWSVVAQRSAGNWKMLAVLALGVLVTATLLAAAPIYSRAMSDLGLTFTLREQLEGRAAARVTFTNIPLGTEEGRALNEAVSRRIRERLGWYTSHNADHLVLGHFSIVPTSGEAPAPPPLGQPQSLQGYREHVRVLSGRLPTPGTSRGPLEVVMSAPSAAAAGLAAGDSFALLNQFDNCERSIPLEANPPPPPPCDITATAGLTLPAILVGIVEPLDARDNYWSGGASLYFDPVRKFIPDAGPVLPLLAEEEALTAGVGGRFPGFGSSRTWNIFANPDALTSANFARAQDDQRALQAELSSLGAYGYSPLTGPLAEFARSSSYQQKPLTVLLLEIAAIALFYVSLISAAVVERQSREIALFQGRGASTGQVVLVYLFEGLLVGLVALLLAPFLAASSTSLLGLTPLFEDVSGGELLPVTIPPLSYPMAALGVALAIAALILPAWLVARRGALAQRRAESRPGRGFFQRYYLDLVLALFAALLLWELNERGSVFTPSDTGGVSSDPVLLASPALIIAAAAALTLRFYPLLLRLVTRAVARFSGVTVAIGLWQVVRNPGRHTGLTLLLMMAVAVGTFAASYSSTAERSYSDRAAFEVGVDMRAIAGAGSRLDTRSPFLEEALATVPGIESASAVARVSGGLATSAPALDSVQVLGVDPVAAGNMLWFREDFADRPLEQLLLPLGGPARVTGKLLPEGTKTLSIWVNPQASRDSVNVWAKVRDGGDQHSLLELGKLEGTGWRELTLQLDKRGPLESPVSLLAIIFTAPPAVFAQSSAPVLLDDITAYDSAARPTLIEGFEVPPSWLVLPGRGLNVDTFVVVQESPHSGRSAGKFAFGTGGSDTIAHGIVTADPVIPLPVLANADLLKRNGLVEGSTTLLAVGDSVFPVVIRGAFKHFPTMPAAQGDAVVLNREQLLSWLNIVDEPGRDAVNEVWLSLVPTAGRNEVESRLLAGGFGFVNVVDSDEVLGSVQRNPLVAAGGSGILLVAFIAVLTLVGVAMVVTMWMGAQQRRVEFAVLRAIGLSRSQIARILALEYGLVGVVGLLIGAYLGLIVGRRMLSFLNVTETGARVEPGFILETEWSFVAVGAGVILVAFVGALAFAVRVLSRTSDAQALRTD